MGIKRFRMPKKGRKTTVVAEKAKFLVILSVFLFAGNVLFCHRAEAAGFDRVINNVFTAFNKVEVSLTIGAEELGGVVEVWWKNWLENWQSGTVAVAEGMDNAYLRTFGQTGEILKESMPRENIKRISAAKPMVEKMVTKKEQEEIINTVKADGLWTLNLVKALTIDPAKEMGLNVVGATGLAGDTAYNIWEKLF